MTLPARGALFTPVVGPPEAFGELFPVLGESGGEFILARAFLPRHRAESEDADCCEKRLSHFETSIVRPNLVIRSTGAGLFITAGGHVISGRRSVYYGAHCFIPVRPVNVSRCPL